MKILNYGNLAIVFTLIFCLALSKLYPKCSETAFILGLFVMPVYQLLAGFIWWMVTNENKEIRNYFIGVISYFFLIFCFSFIHDFFGNQELIESILSIFAIPTPIILALYFTYILNQHSREQTS